MVINTNTQKTDLGIFPKDWGYVLLDSVAQRGSGHTPNVKIPEYYNGVKKWISLADSNKLDRVYISNTKKTISQKGLDNSSAVKHPSGIVVLSRDAGIGKSAITTDEMAVSQHFMVWKCGEKLDNYFLYYLFQFLKPYFENVASGTTIKTIGLPFFKKFKIPLPLKPEQIEISKSLLNTDNLIFKIEEFIDKKINMKQGTIQELLTGKRRLKGFSQEWESDILKNLIRIITGKSKSKFEDNTGKYLIMDMGSVSKQGENISYKLTNDSANLLQVGDIIMPKDDIGGGNIIGKTTVIDKNNQYVLGDHVYLLKTKNSRINPKFLSYLINSYQVNKEIKSKVVGSAQLGLNKKSIEEILIHYPQSIKEQTLIGETLCNMDLEIDVLKKQLDKFIKIKQGMMQKLLTGEIRLV